MMEIWKMREVKMMKESHQVKIAVKSVENTEKCYVVILVQKYIIVNA